MSEIKNYSISFVMRQRLKSDHKKGDHTTIFSKPVNMASKRCFTCPAIAPSDSFQDERHCRADGVTRGIYGKDTGGFIPERDYRLLTGPRGVLNPAGAASRDHHCRLCRAIEGDEFFEGCVAGLGVCDGAHPCPMHHSVEPVRKEMFEVLHQATVYELAMGLKNEDSLLIR